MIRSVTINVLNFQINLLSRACSNREHNNFTEVVLGLPQVPMMVLALLSNVLNSEPFFLLAVWSFFLTLFFFFGGISDVFLTMNAVVMYRLWCCL
jgi:hypothetical protein